MKSATEILEQAAQLLSERGWCQGKLIEQDGSLCTMGAVQMAAGWEETTTHRPSWFITPESFMESGLHTEAVKELNASDEIMTANMDGTLSVTMEEVTNRLQAAIGEVVHIPEWNDNPMRSAEDVILVVKQAAHMDKPVSNKVGPGMFVNL